MLKGDIPSEIAAEVAEKRRELIESVSEVDDELADLFLNDQPITAAVLSVGFEFAYLLYVSILNFSLVCPSFSALRIDYSCTSVTCLYAEK